MLIKKGREIIIVGKMTKEDKRQIYSCLRKCQYGSEQLASKIARRASKRSGEHIRPYSCDFCKGWHIGHRRKVDHKTAGEDNTPGS